MRTRALGKLLLAIAATMALCNSRMTLASTGGNEPLTVDMSLMTNKTVSLGEPIILNSHIVNTDGQTLAVHLGSRSTEWYSISLTDAAGQAVAAVPDAPTPNQGGLQINPDRPLLPGGVVTKYIVVTQNFLVPHPGQYELTVHVYLSYAPVASTERAPSVWKKALADAGTTQTQDFMFPVSVTAFNPVVLHQQAVQLQQEISNDSYSPLGQTLTAALFSMPEAQAADCWRALTSKPSMALTGYAEQLKRLATPTAADILAEMLSEPGLNTEDAAYIGQCLNEMYNAGNIPLRQHIAGIAAAHGLSLPDQVVIPQVAD